MPRSKSSQLKRAIEGLSPEQIQQLEIKTERELVKTDLLYLCREYLGYADLNEKLHSEVARELAKLTTAEAITRKIGIHKLTAKEAVFMLPRTHLKSSLITIAWVIQQILNDPNTTVAIMNAVYANAAEFVREIQSHLLSEKLINLFPDILCSTFKEYQNLRLSWGENIVNVKRTKIVRGNTIEAMGIEASMAGKHFDIMIFDDIQNEINSINAEAINKVIYKYKNCYSVLKPGGIRIIVGTKWKKEDFYYWLEDNGYKVFKKCATIKPNGDTCSVLDKEAIPIFPEMFTIEELRKLRREQGAYFYSCQYENNPLPDEEATFKPGWIKTYDVGREPVFKHIYILLDPALSKTRTADETVMCVIAQPEDKTRPLYCLKSKGIGYQQTKGDVQKVIDELFAEYASWQGKYDVKVGIESVAFQNVLSQWIRKQQMEKGIHFTIEELKTNNRQKEARIQRLQPLFENGGILLNPVECESLKTQLLAWPSSTHDDHPDALAYILDVLVSGTTFAIHNYLDTKKRDHHSLENVLARLEAGDPEFPGSWRDY